MTNVAKVIMVDEHDDKIFMQIDVDGTITECEMDAEDAIGIIEDMRIAFGWGES